MDIVCVMKNSRRYGWGGRISPLLRSVLSVNRNGMIRRIVCIAMCLVGTGVLAQENADDPLSFWERATVYRDEWGTPHVYADDFRALGFGFGYAQAADHLESMLVAFRIANGRAAEVFGEAYAPSDEFSIKMGHAMLAASAYPRLDPVTRDLCEGFAMGVNAWIVEHADQVPAWADGVNPADPLALLHCYLMSMAPFDLEGAFRRIPGAVSGNAWAVGPQKSASGEPLLVINPHTTYDGPFQWYEAHLVCQDMNVAGATLYGLPVILQGHNEHLGWALSPNEPDFADIYSETAAFEMAQDPRSLARPLGPASAQYMQMLMMANSRPYYVSTPDGVVERGVPCLDTPRGPIIHIENSKMWSYQVGGYHDLEAMPQLVSMARATNLTAFQAALMMHQLPCFHVVYADGEGNIFYLYNAKMGVKAVSQRSDNPSEKDFVVTWTQPVPGDDPVYAWGDTIPISDLPAVTNPGCGYVQACGTPPWSVGDEVGIKRENFAEWFARDADSYRAQRTRRLLAMGKRSFYDCTSMLYDISAPLAMDVIPRLLEAAEQNPEYVAQAHPDLAALVEMLRGWNCLADTSSVEMTLFHVWWTVLNSMRPQAFATEADFVGALRSDASPYYGLLLNAAADAVRMMRNEFNSISVPWGDVHTVKRGEREVALPGAMSGQPMFVASDTVYDGRHWRANYGYGFAMVVAFGERVRAESMVPFGSSENADSPHYADQLTLMTQRRFKTAWFDLEDVQRNAASAAGRILYLRPKGVEGLVCMRAPSPVVGTLVTSTSHATPLPDGLAPFSLYVQSTMDQPAVPVDVALEMHVPSAVCADVHLAKLAVYAWDESGAWAPVAVQRADGASRMFFAQDTAARTYVIAGPAQYRLAKMVVPGADKPAPAAPSDAGEREDVEPPSVPSVEISPPHEVIPVRNPNAVLVPSPVEGGVILKEPGTPSATPPTAAPEPVENPAPQLPEVSVPKDAPASRDTATRNFNLNLRKKQ